MVKTSAGVPGREVCPCAAAAAHGAPCLCRSGLCCCRTDRARRGCQSGMCRTMTQRSKPSRFWVLGFGFWVYARQSLQTLWNGAPTSLYTGELGVIGRTQSRRSRPAWVHVARPRPRVVWLVPVRVTLQHAGRNVGENGRSEGSALGFSCKPANLVPTRTTVSRMRIRANACGLSETGSGALHCRPVRSCPSSRGEISTDVANCAHLSSVDERCD